MLGHKSIEESCRCRVCRAAVNLPHACGRIEVTLIKSKYYAAGI